VWLLSVQDTVALEILPSSGRLAVEVDGEVARATSSRAITSSCGPAQVPRVSCALQDHLLPTRPPQAALTDSAEIPLTIPRVTVYDDLDAFEHLDTSALPHVNSESW